MKVFAALLLIFLSQTALSENYVVRSKDGKLERLAFQSSEGSSQASAANLSPCLIMVGLGEVIACEPDAEIHISAVPNDSEMGRQWGLTSAPSGIAAYDAWDLSIGDPSVVVAVIDTGVDLTHPDLIDNLWINPAEIPNNGIDDDNDGFVDDLHGVNFITPEVAPMDDNGHGTHVSGIIGARADNGFGVSGVNWRASILVAKALNQVGAGSLFDAVRAVEYITDLKLNRGVNISVINASWGMSFRSELLKEALDRAIAAGIVVVAAAGNYAQNADGMPQYPAAFESEGIVSVAAIDQNGDLATFSNFGINSVDVAAPGVNILSTYPGNRYVSLSGTSMAAPFVSGAAALMSAYQPGSSVNDIKARLLNSGTDLTGLSGVILSGRTLNLSRMLRNQTAPIETNPRVVAPKTKSDMSLLYLDDQWRAGSRRHVYILGESGERAFMRIRSSSGRCSARKIQFQDQLLDLVVRVPRSDIAGRVKFDLLDSSGSLVESRRVRLITQRGSSRAFNITRTGRRSFKRWCSEVRTVSR